MIRPRRGIRSVLFVTLLVWAAVAGGVPSARSSELEPRLSGEGGVGYRTWDVSDSTDATTTITQLHLPFSATVPFGPGFDVVAYGAFASTDLVIDESDEGSLKGVTDFRLKAFWRPGNRAFLAVGVNLPVGKQTLRQGSFEAAGRPEPGVARGRLGIEHDGTDDGSHHEVEVAQVMWSPLLGFRAKRMAQGFDVDLSAGTAFALSPTATLGFGAGYIVKGEYDFIETEDGVTAFRPAGEASANVGLDVRPNDDLLFRFDVAGRFYGDDEQGGRKVFHAAPQFELDALVAGRSSGWNWLLRARDVVKGDDEILSESGDSDLTRTAQPSVDSFWAVGELYRRLSPTLAFGASVEYGSFGASPLTLSDGHTLNVGPGVRFGGPATQLSVRGGFLSGSAEDGALDLSGLDVSATVTFRL